MVEIAVVRGPWCGLSRFTVGGDAKKFSSEGCQIELQAPRLDTYPAPKIPKQQGSDPEALEGGRAGERERERARAREKTTHGACAQWMHGLPD